MVQFLAHPVYLSVCQYLLFFMLYSYTQKTGGWLKEELLRYMFTCVTSEPSHHYIIFKIFF